MYFFSLCFRIGVIYLYVLCISSIKHMTQTITQQIQESCLNLMISLSH